MDKEYKLLITPGHVTGHRVKYVFGKKMGIPVIISWISGSILCATALFSSVQDGFQAPEFLNKVLETNPYSEYWKDKPQKVVSSDHVKVSQDSVTNHENNNIIQQQPIQQVPVPQVSSVPQQQEQEQSMDLGKYNSLRVAVELDLGSGSFNFPMLKSYKTQFVNNLEESKTGWSSSGILIKNGNSYGLFGKINNSLVGSEFIKQNNLLKCYTLIGPPSSFCKETRREDVNNFIHK